MITSSKSLQHEDEQNYDSVSDHPAFAAKMSFASKENYDKVERSVKLTTHVRQKKKKKLWK